jgi:PAS domain S-box-containing protein
MDSRPNGKTGFLLPARSAAILVVFIGALSLLGWVFDIQTLKHFIPYGIAIKANTAVALLLAGLSLCFFLTDRPRLWKRRIGQACASLVLALGGLSLSEHIFGWNLRIDQILFREAPDALATGSPGRVGPPASLCFILIGAALLLLHGKVKKYSRLPHVLATAVVLVAATGLLGYAYGVESLYGIATYTAIAFHTALALAILAIGILLATPDEGMASLLYDQGVGGSVARRLMPAAIIVPLILGWLRLHGEQLGFYEAAFGTAVMMLIMTTLLSALVLSIAAASRRTEKHQQQAEEMLRKANDELEARVRQRTSQLHETTEAVRSASLYARGLLESSLDPLVTISPEGKITDVNRATELATGAAREELVGSDFSQYFTEPQRASEGYRNVLAEGLVRDYPLTIRHASGGTMDVLYNATVYKNEAGQMQGVFAAARDITAKKAAEAELAKYRLHLEELVQQRTGQLEAANAQLRAVFDVVNVGMLLVDENGMVKRVNNTLSRWVGRDLSTYGSGQPGDFVGCVHAIADPAGCGKTPHCAACPIRRAFESVLRSKQAVHDIEAEATVVIDGAEVCLWLEVSVDPLILDGKPHAILAMNNITARKQGEAALERSVRRFGLLAQSAETLLQTERPQQVVEELCRKVMEHLECDVFFNFLVDEDSGRLHLNACAGIPPEEASRIEWLDYGSAVCGCVAREGHRIVAENIPTTPDPRTELVKSYGIRAYACHPILGPRGKVLGTLSFGARGRDTFSEADLSLMKAVTDQVVTAMIRLQSQEELRQTADELTRSNEDLGQFAYVASHDLQEPLRMVTGFVQLLQKKYGGKLDADADKFIEHAVDGAKRMQTLINDLLAYSRVGTSSREPTPTDAGAAIKQALGNLRTSIEEASAEVTHGELPTVHADGGQLAQIFQNLIGNALKFRSASTPKIHVEACREDGHWRFSVRDNGIGIAPEFQDRIFLIFQRLHTRRQYPGTGIGLAICKKIVDRHGGQIWVESQSGQGATFYFTLPTRG